MSAAPGSGVEREIKIPVPDLEQVRARLQELGSELLEPRAFERNRVFDRTDGGASLLDSGRLLRLREDGAGSLLTHKGVARFEGGAKIRAEHEVRVDSAENAVRILEGIGFGMVKRYEKWRETWRLGSLLVALDETPIGRFVEVEETGTAAGDRAEEGRESLEEAARRLGLDPAAAEPRSYLALWEAWRSEHADAPPDMVFSEAGEGPGA